MKVHVKTKPAFTVVGTEYFGKNENNEIKAMWQTTSPRLGEIQHANVPPNIAYGVCGEMEEDGRFRYMAAVEVNKVEDLPEGMTSWKVPEQTYAVFGCTLPEIHQTYEYAHGTWIPENGYKRAPGPDFEYYDEHFDPADPASLLYIYIPITN
jgi:predicted transcriptional regulator YdeE